MVGPEWTWNSFFLIFRDRYLEGECGGGGGGDGGGEGGINVEEGGTGEEGRGLVEAEDSVRYYQSEH